MAVLVEKRSGRQKRQRAKRLGILTDAQVAMGWFVVLALAALVGAIYLSQASNIASTGRKVQILQNNLEIIKRDNTALERTIAEAQSLERMQQEAARLGFLRAAPEDMEYLVVPQYPAPVSAEPAPDPARVAAVPAQSIGEAILLALRSRINDMALGQAGQ
jgi:cell division protein FtsL